MEQTNESPNTTPESVEEAKNAFASRRDFIRKTGKGLAGLAMAAFMGLSMPATPVETQARECCSDCTGTTTDAASGCYCRGTCANWCASFSN